MSLALPFASRRWLRYLLITLLLLIAAFPWLVSDGVRYWLSYELRQQGLDEVKFERLWINPYTARVEIEGMVWQRGQQSYELKELHADVSWWDLLSKTLTVETLQVAGLDISVQQQQDQWAINGLPLPDSDNADAASAENDSETTAVPQSEEDVWHIAIDGIEVQDVLVSLQSDSASVRSEIEEIKLQPLHTGLDGESELHLSIGLQKLSLSDAKLQVSSHLNYTALLDVKRTTAGDWQSLILGNLTLADLKISSGLADDSKFLADVSRAEVGVTTELQFSENLSHYSNVELNISESSFRHNDNLLLDFFGFSLNSGFNGETLSLNNLVLSGLNVLPSMSKSIGETGSNDESVTTAQGLVEEAYIYLDSAEINLPSESKPLEVKVEQLSLAIADIYLQRKADGSIAQLQQLQALQSALTSTDELAESTPEESVHETSAQASSPASKPQTEATAPSNILLKRFTVESEVALHFHDESVSPRFRETLKLDYLDAENIRLTEPVTVSLNSYLSHEANLSANATLNLVDLSGSGKVELKQYELLSASAYGEYFTGYALEAGQLSINSQFNLENNQLDSKTLVDIDQLHLRPEHSDVSTRFAHQLTMPLDQAMDLLRDGDNRIHLEVPVRGHLDNPDVELQQVINTAVRGAMKKASMAMLSTLLQPYGAALSIAQMAGEEMTRVRLAPMPFQPGESELNADALAYANKVSVLISERPSLRVKLCGLSTEADRVLLQQRAQENAAAQQKTLTPEALAASASAEILKALAQSRSQTLKNYFQTQGQVPSQQLFMCLPKHIESADPGVELSI